MYVKRWPHSKFMLSWCLRYIVYHHKTRTKKTRSNRNAAPLGYLHLTQDKFHSLILSLLFNTIDNICDYKVKEQLARLPSIHHTGGQLTLAAYLSKRWVNIPSVILRLMTIACAWMGLIEISLMGLLYDDCTKLLTMIIYTGILNMQ